MIPEILDELRSTVRTILGNTPSYAIPPDSLGRVRFFDVGESVVALEKWCWISRSALTDVINQTEGFDLVGDFIAKKDGTAFPSLPDFPVQEFPKSLFFGASSEMYQRLIRAAEIPSASLIRTVANPEDAACIAIFLTDFGDGSPGMQPIVVRIDTSAAATAGVQPRKTPSTFYVLERLNGDFSSVFAAAESAISGATWKVRLNETLYMEYSDQARIAAEFLFRLKSQAEVEKAVVAHLEDSNPSVRRNVAQALGLPSFKSGFQLSLPTPSIQNLLEPVSVQPDTLARMLHALSKENDLEVLHWLLCSFSAQFYGGKLKPFVEELQALSRELDHRFGDGISEDTIALRKTLAR